MTKCIRCKAEMDSFAPLIKQARCNRCGFRVERMIKVATLLLEALEGLLEICKGIPHGESLTYGEELAVDHAIKQAVTAVAAAKGEQCQ